MFFYLSKLIDFLLEPIVWAISLLLLAYFRPKKSKKLALYSLIILFFFSNEFIFMEVSRLYEIPSPKNEWNGKKYQAAIVLGGMIHFNKEQELIEFEGSSDRILNVLPLYFQGKIEKIIIAGGSGRLLQDQKESPYLRDYLMQIGVDHNDILIEDRSRNTYENAKYAKEIIENNHLNGPFLLSTSASHMRRSIGCFEKFNIEVEAFPVDFLSRKREFNPDRILRPKAHILRNWNSLIHEWVGFLFYKIAGYC